MTAESELFKTRLAETIAWCTARVRPDDPIQCLRSPELKPYLFHDREIPKEVRARMTEQFGGDLTKRDAYDEDAWFQFMMGAGQETWLELTTTLGSKRHELLLQTQPDFRSDSANYSAGYLLFFEDDRSELDGSAAEASQGFLNSCDVAPWDSWVMYLPKDYERDRPGAVLISWVPPEFEEIVMAGIEATEDAVLYMTECAPEFSPVYQSWVKYRASHS